MEEKIYQNDKVKANSEDSLPYIKQYNINSLYMYNNY